MERSNYNITGKDVANEIAEHIVLEKTGVLHEHITAIKPKPKKKSSGFWFNTIAYTIVGIELWLIYKAILAL